MLIFDIFEHWLLYYYVSVIYFPVMSGPEVIKLFFKLNSAEHELFLLINVKMAF